MEPAPEIDRVEWLSASSEAVLVRVHGRGVQPRSDDELRLIVDDAGHRRAFPPDQGVHVNYHTGEWTACFSVPIELRPSLEENLALEMAGLVVALPAALAGGAEGGPTADAQVIDRGVLAERRARRAELAEQGLLRRAAEAEATVDTLQRQLTNLEQRFAKTNEEIERLRPRLAQGEAERRRLRQREYAEQQQRLEAEERVRELEARIAGERDGLRVSLRKAEQETQTLAAELERVQRALAEAQHSAASEQASLRRVREELASREPEPGQPPTERVFVRVDSTEERVQALGEQLRSISDHLALRELALEDAQAAEREAREALAGERARHDEELAGLQRRVEDLRSELVAAIGFVRQELEAEHDARAQAERELEAEQAARAQAERELQAEQEAREQAQSELEAEQAAREQAQSELEAEQAARREAASELEAQRAVVQQLSDELEAARTAAAGTALALGDLPLEHAPAATSEAELRRQREEMAEALAAAVARLRDRVAEFEQAEPVSAEPVSADAVSAEPPGAADAGAEPAAPASTPAPPVPWTVAETGSAAPAAAGAPGSASPAAVPGAPPLQPAAPEGLRPPAAAEPAVVPGLAVAGTAPGASPAAATPVPGDPPAMPPPEAVELPLRLQGVRARPTTWLATALQRAAVHRDTQLVGELIAELLPAQGLVVRRAMTYGVTIDEVGCYRVATTGSGPASVASIDPGALRGLDFEVRGSVANIGAFAAGRGSWRLRGLRVTPGRRHRARRVARARRVPLTLAELAAANIRVWPGLLLPVLAEAIDPQWTAGESFLIALAITGVTPTALYVGVNDGAPVTVSPRRFDVLPTATLYLSEQACLNLLARTPLPAGERVLCTGDRAAAERLLDWMDRAQGLGASAS